MEINKFIIKIFNEIKVNKNISKYNFIKTYRINWYYFYRAKFNFMFRHKIKFIKLDINNVDKLIKEGIEKNGKW